MNDLDKPVSFQLSRKTLLIIGICVTVVVLGIAIWQTRFYNTFWRWIMPATLTVQVNDKDSQKGIEGASILAQKKTATTDTNGKVEIKGLYSRKNVEVDVVASKYIKYSQKITLKRGANTLNVDLNQDIRKVTVAGFVTNYVNGEKIADIEVENAVKNVTTDKDGNFSIANVPVGELDLKISKEGFLEKIEKVNVDNAKTVDLKLVPEGKVIFVSNRDGEKRGIYSANYDGSASDYLINRKGNSEDFNVIINQEKSKIAFLSTRDGRKDKNNNDEASLFIANTKGGDIQNVNQDYGIRSIEWSADGTYLTWVGQPSQDDNKSYLYIKKNDENTAKVSESPIQNYDFNHKGDMIAWSQQNPEIGIYFKNLTTGETKKINDGQSYVHSFTNDDRRIKFSFYDDVAKVSKYIEYQISDGSFSDYQPDKDNDVTKIKSPHGTKYAYTSNRDGKSDIYMSDINGENEVRLTTMGTVSGNPVWDISGEYVLFDSRKQAETAKFIVGLNQAEPKKITDIYLYDNYGY